MDDTKRVGPKITMARDCSGCVFNRSKPYLVQGDSGAYVWCDHPTVASKYIGDTSWVTPDWCPELASAEEEREVEKLRAIARMQSAEIERLRDESDRLDWLERVSFEAIEIESFIADDPNDESSCVFIEYVGGERPQRIAVGKSLRIAIDVAREKMPLKLSQEDSCTMTLGVQ